MPDIPSSSGAIELIRDRLTARFLGLAQDWKTIRGGEFNLVANEPMSSPGPYGGPAYRWIASYRETSGSIQAVWMDMHEIRNGQDIVLNLRARGLSLETKVLMDGGTSWKTPEEVLADWEPKLDEAFAVAASGEDAGERLYHELRKKVEEERRTIQRGE